MGKLRGCDEGDACDWRVCVKKGRHRPRSFFISLLPLVLVISIWPFIGIYRQFVFTTPFPYPLTLAFLVHLITFFLGICYFGVQIAGHGFTCGGGHRKTKKSKFDSNGKEIKRKGPETPLSIAYRFLHWAFFPALFSSIFIYSAYSSLVPCVDNPNLCTLLFRADLWMSCLVFLSIAKAKRRGGRLDWLIAVLLTIGICTLQWNSKDKVNISLNQDMMMILLGGFLSSLSFGLYVIMLRKATLQTGIFKVLWIQSFWGCFFMMPLSIYFDRNEGWMAAYRGERTDWTVIWHMAVLIFGLIFFEWAITMAIAYSETIIVSLALTISLFLGDFGVYGYITDGFVFNAANIVGIILCGIAVLWLLKRMIVVSCPNLFGGFCGSIFSPENPEEPEEEMDLLGDGFLDDDDYGPPKHSTHSSTKASSSSKLAKSSKRDYDYGSTQPRNPLFDVEMSERSERSGRGRSDSDYDDDSRDSRRNSSKRSSSKTGSKKDKDYSSSKGSRSSKK